MVKSQAKPRRRKSVDPKPDSRLERIRAVLLELGGEAHRREVIQRLAREAGLDERHVPQELEAEVIRTFEETWRDERRRQAYGFFLRFGEGSHRWGVLA